MANKRYTLPLIPLKGLTVFPGMILHFDVGRKKSVAAIENAMTGGRLIMLCMQPDIFIDDPNKDDLMKVGTIAEVKQILRLPNGNMRVLVDGLDRARITKFHENDDFIMVNAVVQPDIPCKDGLQCEVMMRKVQHLIEEFLSISERITPEAVTSIMAIDDPGELAYITVANFPLKPMDKQSILEERDIQKRLDKLVLYATKEIEILKIESEIDDKVKISIDKNQRDYYLREQLKAIREELGEDDTVKTEVNRIRGEAEKRTLPECVAKKIDEELEKIARMSSHSQDFGLGINYLQTVLELPWDISTKENLNIKRAKSILERDHYGLEKVKERIIEYLAVRKLSPETAGSILCLAGPPGTGKTSIVKSLAEALGRKYARISLGGIQNEAEIRGHRRTYVGSMPGRIIAALKTAQSNNPLILLDEIDKMSSDFRGDPTAAMLEVLDPEQNSEFRDHYLELPFDLSKVLFITTANDIENIPRPLIDRMDIIEISGYTEDEKLNIAKKYLIPKQRKKHGLSAKSIKITDKILKELIEGYTRESGVRGLERKISALCRKTAREIVEENKESITISSAVLKKYLGGRIFSYDEMSDDDALGMATGLAWTQVGGDTLFIEVNVMEGSGNLELTGNLGDVMKESAKAALSYIRANADTLKVKDKEFYKNCDIHVHVPEGAVPKDGPSAGITMATAMISALSGVPVRRNIAMTGEISIRGRVLAIGGLKEKSLAAYRMGIRKLIIPFDNKKDFDELPAKIRDEVEFVFAKDIKTVLKHALKYTED